MATERLIHHEIPLDDAEALTEIVRPAFSGARVLAAEPIGRGRLNANARIRVEGRDHPFLLRVHMRGLETARKEWAVLRTIYQRVPVPDVVWTSELGGPEGRPMSILRWIEGVPMNEALPVASEADARRMAEITGEVLARIGTFTFRAPGFLRPDLEVDPFENLPRDLRSGIEEGLRKDIVGERLGETLRSQLLTFVMRFSHRLGRVREISCLGHADFNPEHIILRRNGGDWSVAGVIDWEFAFSGPQLFDIGSMLRRTDAYCPAFAEPYTRAFAEHGGDLPPDWRQLSRLCDMVNLVDFLARPVLPDDIRDFVLAAARRTAESLGG